MAVRAAIWLLLLSLLLLPAPASAQSELSFQPRGDLPALFSADEVQYDERAATVTASGNVEIAYDNR
ncbi:MAG: hypothetical protein WD270_07995, partial [Acetobacterales bacterium]